MGAGGSTSARYAAAAGAEHVAAAAAATAAAVRDGAPAAVGFDVDDAEVVLHLRRLIAYAEGADAQLQREVAERLANEAVRGDQQERIVRCGGLALLGPLTRSADVEVQRLATHALANLSVLPANQALMAPDGVAMLVDLLRTSGQQTVRVRCARRSSRRSPPRTGNSRSAAPARPARPQVLRQAAKALANIAVCAPNKAVVVAAGGVPLLVAVVRSGTAATQTEAVAALANLAVDDDAELRIAAEGGVDAVVRAGAAAAPLADAGDELALELLAQACRALRNLSVASTNKELVRECGGVALLHACALSRSARVRQQAQLALANLQRKTEDAAPLAGTGPGAPRSDVVTTTFMPGDGPGAT